MVAGSDRLLATAVAGLPGHDAVLAGYRDGAILYSEIEEFSMPRVVKRPGGAQIVSLAVTPKLGWLFAAAEDGRVLWGPLGDGGA